MTSHDTTMAVECRTCPVRELHCADCMVPVLLDLAAPALRVDYSLDPDERAVVTRLVHSGLVSPETAARVRARAEPVPGQDEARSEGGRAVG
ncbi:hypothetical protein GCM10023168_20340 [Fodinibacter luteus]|uniref:Uncharacterized protein n=1 Tax=Fodinibacter luteus TaxID=552064 RepID=A0ABP8KG63_9MICO